MIRSPPWIQPRGGLRRVSLATTASQPRSGLLSGPLTAQPALRAPQPPPPAQPRPHRHVGRVAVGHVARIHDPLFAGVRVRPDHSQQRTAPPTRPAHRWPDLMRAAKSASTRRTRCAIRAHVHECRRHRESCRSSRPATVGLLMSTATTVAASPAPPSAEHAPSTVATATSAATTAAQARPLPSDRRPSGPSTACRRYRSATRRHAAPRAAPGTGAPRPH